MRAEWRGAEGGLRSACERAACAIVTPSRPTRGWKAAPELCLPARFPGGMSVILASCRTDMLLCMLEECFPVYAMLNKCVAMPVALTRSELSRRCSLLEGNLRFTIILGPILKAARWEDVTGYLFTFVGKQSGALTSPDSSPCPLVSLPTIPGRAAPRERPPHPIKPRYKQWRVAVGSGK